MRFSFCLLAHSSLMTGNFDKAWTIRNIEYSQIMARNICTIKRPCRRKNAVILSDSVSGTAKFAKNLPSAPFSPPVPVLCKALRFPWFRVKPGMTKRKARNGNEGIKKTARQWPGRFQNRCIKKSLLVHLILIGLRAGAPLDLLFNLLDRRFLASLLLF